MGFLDSLFGKKAKPEVKEVPMARAFTQEETDAVRASMEAQMNADRARRGEAAMPESQKTAAD
jgi:hypothetical protein